MSRSVLAEAIMTDLLAGCRRALDVSVASASVGPAPPGTRLLFALNLTLKTRPPSCLHVVGRLVLERWVAAQGMWRCAGSSTCFAEGKDDLARAGAVEGTCSPP